MIILRERSVYSNRKIIHDFRYYYQLTEGCRRTECRNKFCRSSEDAIRMTPDVAAIISIQLASSQRLVSVWTASCPSLSSNHLIFTLIPYLFLIVIKKKNYLSFSVFPFSQKWKKGQQNFSEILLRILNVITIKFNFLIPSFVFNYLRNRCLFSYVTLPSMHLLRDTERICSQIPVNSSAGKF